MPAQWRAVSIVKVRSARLLIAPGAEAPIGECPREGGVNLSQAESRAVPPVVPPVEPPATHSVVSGQAMHCAHAALLAPHEARAPTANLSPTKRAALLACVKGDGTLHKCMGVWKSRAAQAGERPIFGVTVADLARDGMVTVTATGKYAIAALTPRGSWFARTAATELAEQA
jgi:hypothetical protein